MLEAIFRPIEWVGPKTQKRARSRFSVGYLKLLDDLEIELRKLAAHDVVIQIALDGSQIRNDGWPRAGVNPSWPGVILQFTTKGEVVSMPCDTYPDWKENLRAISLTLRGLRLIDEYGVTKNGQQYQGFKKLDAPSTEAERLTALTTLAQMAAIELASLKTNEAIQIAYKAAARKHHPDLGGSQEEFIRLQSAMAVLNSTRKAEGASA